MKHVLVCLALLVWGACSDSENKGSTVVDVGADASAMLDSESDTGAEDVELQDTAGDTTEDTLAAEDSGASDALEDTPGDTVEPEDADTHVDVEGGDVADADGDAGPVSFAWNDYIGAHYSARPWARGGLRDPASAGSNGFRPRIEGEVLIDDRLELFEQRTLPVIVEVLRDGGSLVLQAAGGATYWEAMAMPAGRAAFEQALRDRIALIHSHPDAAGWESRIVFQFGNEIQNPERFYGEVCNVATDGAELNCDFDTEFVPTYVEMLLAPGAEILRTQSQELFGRPDAIRVGLGSVVGLLARRSFIEGLLNWQIEGPLAPTLAGAPVSRFIDTVTIHYTMPSLQAPAALEDFFSTWTSPEADSSIRALWMTEEVGVRAASGGEGFAAALRAMMPALRWWKSRGLTPYEGHLFIWGAEVECDPSPSPDCLSVDEAMPVFHAFVGDNELVEAEDAAVVEATTEVEVYSYTVGPDKRLVVVWSRAERGTSSTVTSISLNLDAWEGRPHTTSLRKVGAAGLPEIDVVEEGSTIGFSATLEGREVLLLMMNAE